MFMHLYKNRLRILAKNRSLIFWTMAFPLILGLLFLAAFSNLDKYDKLETIDVGIVAEQADTYVTTSFSSALKQAKMNEIQLFKGQKLNKSQAKQKLSEGKVSGYFFIKDDQIELIIGKTGSDTMVLETFLQQYENTRRTLENIAKNDPQLLTDETIEKLTKQHNFVVENQNGSAKQDNTSTVSFMFFTLIGMVCLFGINMGLQNADDEQANQSPKGIRLGMSPVNKLLIVIAHFAAAYTLFMGILLSLLAIFHFIYKVDFGNRWLEIVGLSLLASLMGIAMGNLIGCLFKVNFNTKSSIALSIQMVGSFLAGMMGTTSIKYYIDQHIPILGYLNPVNLISDSLYQLYYYQDISTLYPNLIAMVLFIVVCLIGCTVIERRSQYASL